MKPLANLFICLIIITGWIELSFYPPHNEFDPNPGIPFAERIVARYSLEADIKAESGKFFVYANPLFLFGDSRPQLDYNYSAKPLALRGKWGIGYDITPQLELRLSHGRWIDLGGYKVERLIWNAIQVRYKFEK